MTNAEFMRTILYFNWHKKLGNWKKLATSIVLPHSLFPVQKHIWIVFIFYYILQRAREVCILYASRRYPEREANIRSISTFPHSSSLCDYTHSPTPTHTNWKMSIGLLPGVTASKLEHCALMPNERPLGKWEVFFFSQPKLILNCVNTGCSGGFCF